ncbi:hypothetical protein OEA41_000195 [Lepraria neglecta]|uniref:Uncharacterized protein n=1 Tax=Lepraria neglecta TaxID=209136 RepID=A0AAE0DR85_9LECA|nr:hypothetical protein OEA41_000195 [Lepraria neglecta]
MKLPAEPITDPSKLDSVREHELYRYFIPLEASSTSLSASAASSPDTALTALAQLCALRLHAKRAMVSLIGRETQYFVAESTKTLDLVDNQKYEVEGDSLWFGCGSVDKAGRLCEKTIELPPALGRAPCFTVTDLSKDERFNQLPFVSGPPYFKFYAGTPLTTRRGINIGSLFVVDDVVRPSLNADQEAFLGTIAQTIMKHMETSREAEERKKVMRLSHGMNAFVKGKSRMLLDPTMPKMGLVSRPRASSPGRTDIRSRSLMGRSSKDPISLAAQRSVDQNGAPSDPDTSQDDSDAGNNARTVDSSHRMTFARAANILCDSLDLRGRGGVVFFDTTSRLRQSTNSLPGLPSADGIERKSQRLAEIVSFSTTEEASGIGEQVEKVKSFNSVDENLLHSLLARYPRGKMWSYDQGGCLSSSEEEKEILSPRERSESEPRRQSRSTRKHLEAEFLQKHFPGVRQLMLTGLWDAGRQIFTRETELSFFMAFGNNVMAEVSRLASIAADRQKADFIGSISHEFRSPLHGILASAEFLAETEVDAFQGSLVDTVSSCGRTLLDTINHILDYSKINTFERNWRNVRKPGSKYKKAANQRLTDKEAPPMMNIYATIDVAAVTEEVVEGVYAGQIYQDISSTDATDFANGAKAEALERGTGGNRSRRKVGMAKAVDVIIDIAHENYIFTTQPGALKRVIMNVFGNALKYTQKGSIVVKLSLDESPNNTEDPTEERMLEIKITDTGKGISSEYLRTSLFNPFCQEDVLASGTGLGLSIVKSIVTMLKGSIDVQSEVGKGTEVTIRLPLSRLPGTTTPVSTPSTVTTDGSSGDSMEALQADYSDVTVALHGFDDHKDESGSNVSGRVLKSCIENRAKSFKSGLAPPITFSDEESPIESEADTIVPELENLTLETEAGMQSLQVKTNGVVTASDSNNAQMAIDNSSSEPTSGEVKADDSQDFPFPTQDAMADGEIKNEKPEKANTPSPKDPSPRDRPIGDLTRQDSRRPPLVSRMTEPLTGKTFRSLSAFTNYAETYVTIASLTASNMARHNGETTVSTTPPGLSPEREKRPPRLLLVDDNKINLRLLETYMRKRKYKFVDSAENGQLAVQAAEAHEHGYDIIFMDISMPVMNGFEATRAIRDIEEACNHNNKADKTLSPALIIALTGLASSRDQSEAFTSGVDLFMTKPVSFKEVGRLLDNWEAHGGIKPLEEDGKV